MESSRRYFQMRRQDVAFLRFVIEASDGIAQLTTVDPAGSTVAVVVPPGCEADVEALMCGLRTLVPMTPVAGPALPGEPPAAMSPGRFSTTDPEGAAEPLLPKCPQTAGRSHSAGRGAQQPERAVCR